MRVRFHTSTPAGPLGPGLAAALLMLLAFAVACAARQPIPPPPDPEPMNRETYVVGVTDVLRISVWKNPELSIQVPVRSDGKISVPLLDDVQAEGLEVMELKEVLTRELSEYITAPDVTVIVTQMNSRSITVLGAVGQTGRVPLSRDLRVVEAIAVVGGFTLFADRGDIRIVRRGRNGREECPRRTEY